MRLLICLLLFVALSLTVGKESSSEEVGEHDKHRSLPICKQHLTWLASTNETEREFLLDNQKNKLSNYYFWIRTKEIVFTKNVTAAVKQADMDRDGTIICLAVYSSVFRLKGPQTVKIFLKPQKANSIMTSPTGYDVVRAVVIDTTDTRTPEMLKQEREKVRNMKKVEICEHQRKMIMKAHKDGNLVSQMSMLSIAVKETNLAKYIDPSLTIKEGEWNEAYLSCYGSSKHDEKEQEVHIHMRQDDESETGFLLLEALFFELK